MAKGKSWYVGIEPGTHKRVAFTAAATPTQGEHPEFIAVIGPHRTKAGACLMRDTGGFNPHLQTADDADRIARILRRQAKEQAGRQV